MSAAAPLKRRVVQGSDESIYGRESWSRQQLYICRQQRSIRDSYPRLRRPAWPCAAHVVAFGEPMHGAHEPLAFRNRLFRFLVERMGFTAIALESGFTESTSARPFIEGGEGDAGEIGSLPAGAQAEFDTSIKAIAQAMGKRRKSLIARSSDDEYRWALRNLD